VHALFLFFQDNDDGGDGPAEKGVVNLKHKYKDKHVPLSLLFQDNGDGGDDDDDNDDDDDDDGDDDGA